MSLKPSPVAFLIFMLAGWIARQQVIVIEYLKAENRMLRERLKGRSLRFSDQDGALLARKALGIPRKGCRNWAPLSPLIRCCGGSVGSLLRSSTLVRSVRLDVRQRSA